MHIHNKERVTGYPETQNVYLNRSDGRRELAEIESSGARNVDEVEGDRQDWIVPKRVNPEIQGGGKKRVEGDKGLTLGRGTRSMFGLAEVWVNTRLKATVRTGSCLRV